ncbi:unnamed protein product [Blepharisma stoltei]|uniref:Uncharacterized protein n=1 Tax=Blepharisma stoltei TaxID=1481888 RepID=A0AAU9IW48_9CILI|nr:unnamed protein product [Blepharisma stoltei]
MWEGRTRNCKLEVQISLKQYLDLSGKSLARHRSWELISSSTFWWKLTGNSIFLEFLWGNHRLAWVFS